jgi:glycine betaine/proline transport system permease protein
MADQNPWGTTDAADSAAQSADAWGSSTPAPTDGGAADWLNSAPAPAPEHFNIMDPFHKTLIRPFCRSSFAFW